MNVEKNGVYYIGGIALFLLLKMVYTQMGADDLRFILAPTANAIALLTNAEGKFIAGSGYFHSELNILIEKSCSGFNFLILSFLMAYLVVLNHFENRTMKVLLIVPVFLMSWILTLFANTSRIAMSIVLNRAMQPQTEIAGWLHQAEGTFVYLFLLILFYKILNHTLSRYKPKYEQFS